MGASAEPGLRERKRLATRRAIQLAALQLVDERGVEVATVEAISREADISPRTFFNYFASKDEALIGDGPALPDEETVEAFVVAGAGADVLIGLGDLIAASGREAARDRAVTELRMRVMRENPQLFAVRIANMHRFEVQLVEIIERRLRADDPALDESTVASRARLLAHMASAAIRHAWSSWVQADDTGPLSDRMRQSFAEMRALLRHP